jgi:hypothetical protein
MAMWHWYLRLPITGVTARRLPLTSDIETDGDTATRPRIEPPGDQGELCPSSLRTDPIPAELPTQRPVPALTTSTSAATALEATR